MASSKANLRWSAEDRMVFLNACEKLGTTDWSKVAAVVKSKSKKQCRDRLRKLLLREIQTRMGRRKAQLKRKAEVTQSEKEVYNRVLKNHCRDHGHEVARIIVLIYRDPKGRGTPTPEQAMNVASSLGIVDFNLEELEKEIRQGENITIGVRNEETYPNMSPPSIPVISPSSIPVVSTPSIPAISPSSARTETVPLSMKRKLENSVDDVRKKVKKSKQNVLTTPSNRGCRRSNVVSPDHVTQSAPFKLRTVDHILSPAEKEHFEFHLKLQNDISIAQSATSNDIYNIKAEKNPKQIYVNHLNHTERQAVSAMMSLCSGL